MRTFVAAALGLSVTLVSSCTSSANNGQSQNGQSATSDSMEAATEQDTSRTQESLPFDDANLSIQEQRRAFLVDGYIESARELIRQLELEDAQANLVKALELNPDSLVAKQLLDQVGHLMGKQGTGVKTAAEQLADLHRIKLDVARADATDRLERAKLKRARGDHAGAINELVLCLDVFRLNEYSAGFQEVRQEAETLLAEVRAERESAEAQKQAAERQAAFEEKQKATRAAQARRDAVLTLHATQMVEAFNAGLYEEAISEANQALRLDPHHKTALDVRDTAFRKQRELVHDDFIARKREQYAVWVERMNALRVPNTETITLAPESYWDEITQKREGRDGVDTAGEVEPGAAVIRKRLSETQVPGLKITEEGSLTTVIKALNVVTGLPLVVDPAAENAALDNSTEFDFDFTNSLSAEKVLNLVVDMAGPDVTWTVRHESILITTNEKALGNVVIRNHDVQDLVFEVVDFLAPRIDGIRAIDALEDDDGGSPFGSIGDKRPVNDPSELGDLITNNIAKDTWDENGTSLAIHQGNMVVVHTPDVQRQVKSFLNELRSFSNSMVTIESKFLSISEGFIQEIGVDWRGLDNNGGTFNGLDDIGLGSDRGVTQGNTLGGALGGSALGGLSNSQGGSPSANLDNNGDGVTLTPPSSGAFYDDGGDGTFAGRSENLFNNALGSALTTIGGLTAQISILDDLQLNAILRLVEKSQQAELINDQLVSVHNNQRAYVTVINQRAYVQDFDVEVASFQSVADPVINVLHEGIVLDVRPVIQQSRKYVTLEIQPTVANVISLTNFSTTLAGQTAAVTFQLPEMQIQSIHTTVNIADGSSILIGGLSRLRNVERRAEVPWLANIPIIGFFFKEEGYNDERESLLISLKATITDVEEELASYNAR